jgi:Ca2+-transporting ATPase
MLETKKEKQNGLTDAEILRSRADSGYNELPSSKEKSSLTIIVQVFKEPMFILLLSCGILYFILGDSGEAMMLLASVAIVIGITYYQERKTARALEALRALSSPRALVIRNATKQRIAARDVVPGDLLILQEGDRICADAIVLECLNLKIDESLLTGEAMAVNKIAGRADQKFIFPSEGDSPFVYSGTLVIQGHGVAIVVATGSQSQFGKIGQSLSTLPEESSPLQKESKRIIKTFSILGFSVSLLVILLYGLMRHDWLHAVLEGLSLAMAMLPEEFAVVLTLFMALGAWRMSKKNVLTRKPAAIETLGAVTVLCADKTGTLTHNKMTVRKLIVNDLVFHCDSNDRQSLPPKYHKLMEGAILASQHHPFDPMEQAFLTLGQQQLIHADQLHADRVLEKEYPLSPALAAMTHVFKTNNDSTARVACKGSPEAIAELCHFTNEQKEKLIQQTATLAAQGLRVLAVASADFPTNSTLPEKQNDFSFSYQGLIGLEDPLRDSISDDLQLCYSAGIRVIMITGDYPATAQNIAQQMGLKNFTKVITGSTLSTMSDDELRNEIKNCNVFARVIPQQKLRLVNALKDNGEIVAMTGDGVNDAPALKAAHVGIAMGQRGTDVAREASAMVLLDDNFSSIIAAIRMGRSIYTNLQKAMAYIFSVHIPIAGLTLLPVLFSNLPIILFPLHIAFLELIIDPVCSLIFEGEGEEKNTMTVPPRDATKVAFGKKRVLISFLQGFYVLIISLCVYFIALYLDRTEEETRALTFTTLVVGNIGLILINRSWTRTILETIKEKNASLKWVIGGAVLFLFAVLYIRPLRKLFHFDLLHPDDLLICLAAGIISILWFEFLKIIQRRK